MNCGGPDAQTLVIALFRKAEQFDRLRSRTTNDCMDRVTPDGGSNNECQSLEIQRKGAGYLSDGVRGER
jgi:hypothetical protein